MATTNPVPGNLSDATPPGRKTRLPLRLFLLGAAAVGVGDADLELEVAAFLEAGGVEEALEGEFAPVAEDFVVALEGGGEVVGLLAEVGGLSGEEFDLALEFAALAGIGLGWFWQPLNSFAVTGASYAARVGCSCRFVGGRDLSDCRKDFEPGMELISLSQDVEARSVTARFPLLATQTATYREGAGCVLQPWTE